MDLYTRFADHYDSIFPVDPTTVSFLRESLPKGRVLDLGCATGGHVLALRGLGYRADGIDLDDAMVDHARKKAQAVGSPATFGVADIRSLSANETYEGIVCVGNTLVHLADEREIATLVSRMYLALRSGGTAVIQIVNYDRVLDRHVTALPTIRGDGRVFERAYVHAPGRLVFRTTLTYAGERSTAETPLYPLRQAALVRMMQDAGFRGIVAYGDFDRRPFDPTTSFALVVKGDKR